MVFFSSDHHFFHKNIIKYCNRPFSSVEEMNDQLVKNWNITISKKDIVIYLGDLALSSPEICKDLISELNGQIFMIKGNHDLSKNIIMYKKLGITIIKPYQDEEIAISHFYCNLSEVSIHGHSHGKNLNKNGIDVGVDCHNFFPISLENLPNPDKISKIVTNLVL